MWQKRTFLLLTSLSILAVNYAYAECIVNESSWLPDHARVLASGSAASDVRTIGGDGMLPVFGNSEGFAYADFMGDYGSDDTYLVSPGLGYRKIINNQIAGAYFFADYERVSLGPNFWVMSPGLEWMNSHWDAHVNGYFPTETRKETGDTTFLSDTGDYSQVSFEEGTHNQYDELVAPYAVIGNGVDAEIAYSFSGLSGLRTRAYLGGYYYTPPNDSVNTVNSNYSDINNITGVTAGFEQPISKNLHLALFNSYDNVSNYSVGVSLTATFGQDSTVFSNNIHDRLLDPVQRQVGIIDTGAGTYDQQSLEDAGIGLQYDNVYFIEPAETVVTVNDASYTTSANTNTNTPDGTYGNPMPLNQTSLDAINTESAGNSRIYIPGGTSDVYQVNELTTIENSGGLVVYDGQDFYGTSADYKQPAGANEQPNIYVDDFYSGFITSGGENTFSDISMSGDGSGYSTGIVVDNQIGDETLNVINTNMTGLTGIYASNNSVGALTINVSDSNFTEGASGLTANNYESGELTINVDNSHFDDNYYGNGLAANNYVDGGMELNITDSTFNNNELGTGMNVSNRGAGATEVNVVNSTFDNNHDQGIDARSSGTTGGELTLNLVDSEVNNNAYNGIYTQADNAAALTINATNTIFDDNQNGSGIYAFNNGTGIFTMNLTDSSLNSNSVGGFVSTNVSSGELNISMNNTSVNDNLHVGFQADNNASGSLLINVENSTFDGNENIGFFSYNIGTSEITINNSSFNNNTTNGFRTQNDGTSSIINVTDSSFDNNQANGFVALSGSSVGTTVNITDSTLNSNGNNGLVVGTDSGVGIFTVNVTNSDLSNNEGYGISGSASAPGTVTINYTGSTLTGNNIAPTNEDTATNIIWVH